MFLAIASHRTQIERISSFFEQVVSPEELKDDEEYQDILEDMKEECGKYGMYCMQHLTWLS